MSAPLTGNRPSGAGAVAEEFATRAAQPSAAPIHNWFHQCRRPPEMGGRIEALPTGNDPVAAARRGWILPAALARPG